MIAEWCYKCKSEKSKMNPTKGELWEHDEGEVVIVTSTSDLFHLQFLHPYQENPSWIRLISYRSVLEFPPQTYHRSEGDFLDRFKKLDVRTYVERNSK